MRRGVGAAQRDGCGVAVGRDPDRRDAHDRRGPGAGARRASTPRCEDVFLDLARDGDARNLRRATAHFRNLARADGSEPRVPDGLHVSRTVRATHRAVGRVRRRRGRDGHDRAARVHRSARAGRIPGRRRSASAAAFVRICEVALAQVDRRAGYARGPRSPTSSTGRPLTEGRSGGATVRSPGRSTPTTCGRSSATARSRGSSPDRRRSRSTSADRDAPSHHRCGGRSSYATTDADTRAATDHPAGATRTT